MVIDFDLATNAAVDNGLNYVNYTKAEASTTAPDLSTESFVIGFEIDITAVNGISVDLNPVAAFCSEIAEPIGLGSHSFDLSPLASLASGTAGASGTVSAASLNSGRSPTTGAKT